MQPMCRKHKKFPCKTNNPKWKGGNWWEDENNDGNKATDRQAAKKEIQKELEETPICQEPEDVSESLNQCE